jgi:hypothetical protein
MMQGSLFSLITLRNLFFGIYIYIYIHFAYAKQKNALSTDKNMVIDIYIETCSCHINYVLLVMRKEGLHKKRLRSVINENKLPCIIQT